MKNTNYLKHKKELLELISRSAMCFDCLAKAVCKKLCEENKIDPSKSPAPCKEAWERWVEETA